MTIPATSVFLPLDRKYRGAEQRLRARMPAPEAKP